MPQSSFPALSIARAADLVKAVRICVHNRRLHSGNRRAKFAGVAEVTLRNVTKTFDSASVLTDLSLHVDDGEFCVVLGPSGCGKSTLLRLVAGLEQADSGMISIGGLDVTNLPPQKRGVAMVFQNYALYPHMTVAENIGLPLRLRKVPKSQIADRVRDVAAMLELGDFLERRPRQLSGGQRQRVALGRAIVHQPQVYLFDEPLSNVDALLRVRMRTEIARLWETLNVTVIYVTHDQTEALALGQKICVLDRGKLQQIGNPEQIYHHPDNQFVAGFVGTPPMNLVRGKLSGGAAPTFEPWGLRLPGSAAFEPKSNGTRDVLLGVRPEDIRVVGRSDHGPEAQIERVEFLGNVTWLVCRVGETRIVAQGSNGAVYRPGESYRLELDLSHLHFFDPATGQRL
jgi:multiple sugar transport system ATP-binding protein